MTLGKLCQLGIYFFSILQLNTKEKAMSRHNKKENSRVNNGKDENWLDDLMKRQERDLEVEEEILSTVPKRIRQKYLDEEEE